MQRTITLFIVPGQEANTAAYNTICQVPDLEVEVVHVSTLMQELYVCPFVKDEDDRGYYGLGGISYLAELLSQSAQKTNGSHGYGHNGNGSRSQSAGEALATS